MPKTYEFLVPGFVEAMNDIGKHGYELYGDLPRKREDHRKPSRAVPSSIAGHAAIHFGEYLCNIPHDHFKTRKHQLAAVAFNAMMEYYFAGLENEE